MPSDSTRKSHRSGKSLVSIHASTPSVLVIFGWLSPYHEVVILADGSELSCHALWVKWVSVETRRTSTPRCLKGLRHDPQRSPSSVGQQRKFSWVEEEDRPFSWVFSNFVTNSPVLKAVVGSLNGLIECWFMMFFLISVVFALPTKPTYLRKIDRLMKSVVF